MKVVFVFHAVRQSGIGCIAVATLLAPSLCRAQGSPAQQPVPPAANTPVNPESLPSAPQSATRTITSQSTAPDSQTSSTPDQPNTQTTPPAVPPDQSPQNQASPAGPSTVPTNTPPIAPHRPLLSTAPAKEEGPIKPGIQLADPMLYGPVNCPSSMLGITNPESAAAAKALEADEHGCVVGKTQTSSIFLQFTSTWVPYPMTPGQKLKLAGHDIIDPFNILTIGGLSAITIAANSHSDYGPGFPGFGKYFGVNMTQDITGEFVGTFLINSIAHEDPHYHRMPQASIPMRIGHAIAASVIAQSDYGRPMPNYQNLVGYVVEDKIASLYTPGQAGNSRATFDRVSLGLATAPIGNFVIEFFPDVARRLNIRTIFLQRIINQVARDNGDSGP